MDNNPQFPQVLRTATDSLLKQIGSFGGKKSYKPKLVKMKTQHTKGEWDIISMSNDTYLLTVNSEITDREAEANARLIAAAPELLEALITLTRAVRRLEIYKNPVSIHTDKINQANEAIQKATG
jgi:hypothetical protein